MVAARYGMCDSLLALATAGFPTSTLPKSSGVPANRFAAAPGSPSSAQPLPGSRIANRIVVIPVFVHPFIACPVFMMVENLS